MTPTRYPVPLIPDLSVVMSDRLPLLGWRGGGGSPAEDKSLLVQMSPSGLVAWASLSPTSPGLRSTPDVSPSSGVAAMDQCLPWNGSPPVGESALTPRRMAAGEPENARFVSGGPLLCSSRLSGLSLAAGA